MHPTKDVQLHKQGITNQNTNQSIVQYLSFCYGSLTTINDLKALDDKKLLCDLLDKIDKLAIAAGDSFNAEFNETQPGMQKLRTTCR